MLQEVISDFDYMIERKNATIKTSELPTIDSIPSQMRQVFQNLIGNALKFSGNEEKAVIEITSETILEKSIESPTSPEGKFCRITVKDNGIGLNKNQIEELFKKFTKMSRLGTANEGSTGIGLYLCKKNIERNNGRLTASSEGKNKGAEFRIEFDV